MMIRWEHRHSVTPLETRHFKGGAGKAQAMATAQENMRDTQTRIDEQARKDKIQAAVDAVNAKFAGANRAQTYGDLGGAVTDLAARDLDRQFKQASDQNRYGLARQGLLGGSADAYAGSQLAQRYGEGKIRATQAGASAASDLQSADEKTRQNLIALSQSGVDAGTAANLAANQMAASADLARSNTNGVTIGRLFDDLGQAYQTSAAVRARYPNGLPQQQNTGPSFGNQFSGQRYVGSSQRG